MQFGPCRDGGRCAAAFDWVIAAASIRWTKETLPFQSTEVGRPLPNQFAVCAARTVRPEASPNSVWAPYGDHPRNPVRRRRAEHRAQRVAKGRRAPLRTGDLHVIQLNHVTLGSRAQNAAS